MTQIYEDEAVINARLQAISQYHIIDTPPEREFDDITLTASKIFLVPISLITFIESDRQWFKSHQGTDVSETDLRYSNCMSVIKQKEPLVIPDLTKNERTKDYPMVVGQPGLRFYAGAPLVTPDDIPIGTLCIIGLEPRPQGLSEEQVILLKEMARDVMDRLEHRKYN